MPGIPPDVIPGILQAGVGATQGFLDLGTEFFNQARNAQLAGQLSELGYGMQRDFNSSVMPLLNQGSLAMRQGMQRSQEELGQATYNLNTARSSALDRFADVRPAARSSLDDVLARLTNADARTVSMVKDQFAKNDQYVADTKSFLTGVMDKVRTNNTEQIGNMVAGQRTSMERNVASFIANARKQGWSESDIQVEANAMRLASESSIKDAWMKSTADIGDKITQAGVASGQILGNLQSYISNTNAGLTKAAVDAGYTSASLAANSWNAYTGTLLSTASAESSVIRDFAGFDLDLQQMKADMLYQNGLNVASDFQNRANAVAMSLDFPYEAQREAIAMVANRPFQMPNFAGLINPGLQSISNGLASWRQAHQSAPSNSSSGAWGLGGSALTSGALLGAAAIG